MPSSEYYCRQSETLRALAASTNDPSLSALCRSLAVEYRQLAEQTALRESLDAPDPTFPLTSTRDSV
jgi:hypothetical protein